MVRRLSEFKQKLHPNAKLRAWYASHTFGGTTKAKSLKILGFSKTNFYYIAAGVGALLLIAAVGAGIGVKSSLASAKTQGAQEGVIGQQIIQSTTKVRTRTRISDGQTVVMTETSAFLTTFQRGGGVTEVKTTNEKGEETLVPASLSIATNEDGEIEIITFVASSLVVPGTDDVDEQTLVFGDPTIVTSNGIAITTTVFDDLTVGTDEDGETVTSIKAPEPGATPTGEDDTITPTDPSEATNTAPTTDGAPPAETTSLTNSAGAAPTAETSAADTSASVTSSTPTSTPSSSSAKPSSSSAAASTSAGGGGGGGDSGGEEFSGEATFYAPGLGSCGTDATDDDFVAALSKILFDATGATNSNNNPYCGRKALVKAAGGKRRRGYNTGNMTSGIENWEKSRIERWSRRSALSAGLDLPTPSKNESGNSHEVGTLDSLSMPGITPAPVKDLWERQAGGGGVTITVVDRCPVCKQYDLDLSPAAYDILGSADAGRIPIKWKWLD